MNTFTGSLWIRILTAVLGHRAKLDGRPRLAAFASDFEKVVGLIEAALAVPEGQDALLDSLRAAARGWDKEHDDGHRSLVKLLEAFALRGAAEARAVVAAALAALYPDGLQVVTLTFAEEVGATQVLAQRAKSPVVQGGLAVVAAEVPGAAAWVERIVAAGGELGKALDAIDVRLSELAAAPKGSGIAYLQALNAARRTWGLFLATVSYELVPGVPEDDALRELLVGPYEREVEKRKAETKADGAPVEEAPVA